MSTESVCRTIQPHRLPAPATHTQQRTNRGGLGDRSTKLHQAQPVAHKLIGTTCDLHCEAGRCCAAVAPHCQQRAPSGKSEAPWNTISPLQSIIPLCSRCRSAQHSHLYATCTHLLSASASPREARLRKTELTCTPWSTHWIEPRQMPVRVVMLPSVRRLVCAGWETLLGPPAAISGTKVGSDCSTNH